MVYVSGLNLFEVLVDHKPLLEVFDRDMRFFTNEQLLRIRRKLVDYNFTLHYVQGKSYFVADFC